MRHTLAGSVLVVLLSGASSIAVVNPNFIPERTYRTGAPVFCPSAVLSGIAAVGYAGRLLPAAVWDEEVLVLPFGGTFMLFNGMEKVTLIAQHVRLRRLGIDPPSRLRRSLALYGGTFVLYGATVPVGFATYLGGIDTPVPMGVLLVSTSAMMIASAIADVKAFRANAAAIRRADERRGRSSVSVVPLVRLTGGNTGAGLALVGEF
jgi:hypothetical protein